MGLTIATDAVSDTPDGAGPTVRIKAIVPKGALEADGRLLAGDRIIQVDKSDLRTASHQEAVDAILAALENGRDHITFVIQRLAEESSADGTGAEEGEEDQHSQEDHDESSDPAADPAEEDASESAASSNLVTQSQSKSLNQSSGNADGDEEEA